jgi:predicted nucleic acid-binding protein
VVLNQPAILLDTNIALYYLGGLLAVPLPTGQYNISIITEMELLSYPNLSPTDEQQIRSFLTQIAIVRIDDAIKTMAIALRKQHWLKLLDAIIAATAQSLNALLPTNDLKLSNLGVIKTQSMPL